MASYFDEVGRNNIASALLMLVFLALFGAVVFLAVYAVGGGAFSYGLFAIGMVFVLAYAFISYHFGANMVLALSGAKPADPKQYRKLYSIVEGLSAATQVPMPKIYVISDQSPNAFATGKNKKNAYVAVTTGLLSMMNDNELTGVLAHEMSHVYDNDIKFMLIAVVFAGVIGLIAAVARNMLWFGGGRGRNGGLLILVALAVGIIAPIFALLLRLAISRRREYMADANGARVIRAPNYLASALTKIQAYTKNPQTAPMRNTNEITANLYFSSPFKASSVMNLLSTHPPIEERIARLNKMY
jgi:heat shock protein HtpX